MAFVLDQGGELAHRCNRALVELDRVEEPADRELLRGLLERHARLTGSPRALALLDRWEAALPEFVRVIPTEYRRVLRRRAVRNGGKELVAHG